MQFLLFTVKMARTRWVTGNDDNDNYDNYDDYKVGHCPPSVYYEPQYWWTRYPVETSKFWNLTKLFRPEAWMWTFLSFFLITVTLWFASLLGTKVGLNVGSEEVALIPFRWLLMQF